MGLFKLGDQVIYCGEKTRIAAIYNGNSYIVEHPFGWLGTTNTMQLAEGYLDPNKQYNYAYENDLVLDSSYSYSQFFIGEEVIYMGEKSKIHARITDYYGKEKFVVEYSKGWNPSMNGHTIIEGWLDYSKLYNYADANYLSKLYNPGQVLTSDQFGNPVLAGGGSWTSGAMGTVLSPLNGPDGPVKSETDKFYEQLVTHEQKKKEEEDIIAEADIKKSKEKADFNDEEIVRMDLSPTEEKKVVDYYDIF